MPVDRRSVPTRLPECEQRLAALLRVQHAKSLLVGPVLGVERGSTVAVHEIGEDADHARRVEDVHRRLRVLGSDPHGRVLPRGRRAADEQREREPAPLHLLRDVDHLVEGRRDEAREADDVAVLLERGVEDRVRRDHDAQVEHLVPVAAEDDSDDVLADVVDVALHRREHDAGGRRALLLLRLHERLEVGDGALHGAGALHDLRAGTSSPRRRGRRRSSSRP